MNKSFNLNLRNADFLGKLSTKGSDLPVIRSLHCTLKDTERACTTYFFLILCSYRVLTNVLEVKQTQIGLQKKKEQEQVKP